MTNAKKNSRNIGRDSAYAAEPRILNDLCFGQMLFVEQVIKVFAEHAFAEIIGVS